MMKTIKEVKEIGWDKITLAGTGFKGAVKSYRNAEGKVIALCFNSDEAFIVEDEIGLFGVEDLYSGIIRAKNIDVESTGQIEGAKTVAFIDEDTKVVSFIPSEVERLALTEDQKKDIESRITNLFLFLNRTKGDK